MLYFLGHEIEVSIRIGFQRPKNIALFQISPKWILQSHRTGVLPILRQNLILLIENLSLGAELIAVAVTNEISISFTYNRSI